ncbi:hypothetical protein F9B85_00480 [Heliorestis acidaminivorans]|uniref:PQQ-binding-like beta-propeller repeat protein n=1 Tax=Heliorestis acidaminivorans TaxID=553427 RepID=A0A6I0F2J9_9FIRM|nr:hypothetical protein [Heliorestis acidaminivorans]KAB2954211.1 hypothetical protein F9B85_00480 [Heliorestis acidaminivorans]
MDREQSDLSSDIEKDDIYDGATEREYRPNQSRIVSVSGFNPYPVEPTLPPYRYQKKKNGKFRRWSVMILLPLVLLTGALASSTYFGLIPLGDGKEPLEAVMSWFEKDDDSTNNQTDALDRSEELLADQTLAVTSDQVQETKWQRGLQKEQLWSIITIDSDNGTNQANATHSVQIVPLLSGDFLAVVEESGTLYGLDVRGELLWSKGPEEWGVSGGKRVIRKWTGLARSDNGRVAAFTTGIESVVWWSNPQRPYEEHPLPEESIAPILGVTANNELIRLSSTENIEIVDRHGEVIKEIKGYGPSHQPKIIEPLAQKDLLIVTEEGLLYSVNSEGTIEYEIGHLPKERGPINAVAVDKEGYIFIGTDQEIIIWQDKGEEIYAMPFDSACVSLALTEKGQLLVGDRYGQVHIFTQNQSPKL